MTELRRKSDQRKVLRIAHMLLRKYQAQLQTTHSQHLPPLLSSQSLEWMVQAKLITLMQRTK